MPPYDDKMRLADNLIRIQQERNELLAQKAVLVAALEAVDRELKALRLTKMSVATFEAVQLALAIARDEVPS